MARSFPPELLARLREMPLRRVLESLGYHVATDPDYAPAKDARSERWLVSGPGGTSEFVVTALRWFDTRAGKGGGGGVDLVMHLEGLEFVRAVRRLAAAADAASLVRPRS